MFCIATFQEIAHKLKTHLSIYYRHLKSEMSYLTNYVHSYTSRNCCCLHYTKHLSRSIIASTAIRQLRSFCLAPYIFIRLCLYFSLPTFFEKGHLGIILCCIGFCVYENYPNEQSSWECLQPLLLAIILTLNLHQVCKVSLALLSKSEAISKFCVRLSMFLAQLAIKAAPSDLRTVLISYFSGFN